MSGHVAIIMDGNRRWAAARGLPIVEGYRRGIAALREAVRGALDSGIDTLTVFGFSTENWNREPSEVTLLMQLCALFARNERALLDRLGVRLHVLGDPDAFALPARAGLNELVRATQTNRRLTLNLALNYSGRAEIVRAARTIAQEAVAGKLRPEDVDDTVLRSRMYAPRAADPDLLIRTGGEYRVSNFLLYQIAYTEFVTLPIMWPDFTAQHLVQAVGDFDLRERRYGA